MNEDELKMNLLALAAKGHAFDQMAHAQALEAQRAEWEKIVAEKNAAIAVLEAQISGNVTVDLGHEVADAAATTVEVKT